MNSLKKDPSLAIKLSFFCSGLGQIYAGEVERGVTIFIGALLSLIFPPLWLFIWLWNMFDARDQARKWNRLVDNYKPK